MSTTDLVARATKKTTPVAIIRRWRHRTAPVAVLEIQSRFGLSTRWVVARRLPNGNEMIVSRHRNRHTAERQAAKEATSGN